MPLDTRKDIGDLENRMQRTLEVLKEWEGKFYTQAVNHHVPLYRARAIDEWPSLWEEITNVCCHLLKTIPSYGRLPQNEDEQAILKNAVLNWAVSRAMIDEAKKVVWKYRNGKDQRFHAGFPDSAYRLLAKRWAVMMADTIVSQDCAELMAEADWLRHEGNVEAAEMVEARKVSLMTAFARARVKLFGRHRRALDTTLETRDQEAVLRASLIELSKEIPSLLPGDELDSLFPGEFRKLPGRAISNVADSLNPEQKPRSRRDPDTLPKPTTKPPDAELDEFAADEDLSRNDDSEKFAKVLELAGLKSRSRTYWQLLEQGLTREEVAAQCGVTPEAVKKAYQRTRGQVQRAWEKLAA